MEVEVKVRLLGEEAYNRLLAALPDGNVEHLQQNYFFDGGEKELSSRKVVLRIRFSGSEEKAVITIKGKQILKDGIGRAPEIEEEIDAQRAREFLADPNLMLQHQSNILNNLQNQYNLKALTCLGGFTNLRKIRTWEGLKLEIDQTMYEWGTLYELECETSDPEQAKNKLAMYLKEQQVNFEWTSTSKFANFINKSLL